MHVVAGYQSLGTVEPLFILNSEMIETDLCGDTLQYNVISGNVYLCYANNTLPVVAISAKLTTFDTTIL
jgi:hypothetical protein